MTSKIENRWKQQTLWSKILMFCKFQKFSHLSTTELKLMGWKSEIPWLFHNLNTFSYIPWLFQAWNPDFKFCDFHDLSVTAWTLSITINLTSAKVATPLAHLRYGGWECSSCAPPSGTCCFWGSGSGSSSSSCSSTGAVFLLRSAELIAFGLLLDVWGRIPLGTFHFAESFWLGEKVLLDANKPTKLTLAWRRRENTGCLWIHAI